LGCGLCAGAPFSQPVVSLPRREREEKEVAQEEEDESEEEEVSAQSSGRVYRSVYEGLPALTWEPPKTTFDCFNSSSSSEEGGGSESELSGDSSSSEESSSVRSLPFPRLSRASARKFAPPVASHNQLFPSLPGVMPPPVLPAPRSPFPTMPFVAPSPTGKEFMMMREMDSLQRDLREGREKWEAERKARKKAEKKRKKEMKKKEKEMQRRMEQVFAEKEKLFQQLAEQHRALKDENEELVKSKGELKVKLGEMKQHLSVMEGKRVAVGQKMLDMAEQQRKELRGMFEAMERRREGDLERMEASEADMAAACKSVSEELVALTQKSQDGEVNQKALALAYKLEEMRAKGGLVAVSAAFKPFVESLVFPAVAFQLQEKEPLKVFEEEDFEKLALSRLFLEKSALLKKQEVLVQQLYKSRVEVMKTSARLAGSFMLASKRETIEKMENKVLAMEEQLKAVQTELLQVESSADSSFKFNFLLRFCSFYWFKFELLCWQGGLPGALLPEAERVEERDSEDNCR